MRLSNKHRRWLLFGSFVAFPVLVVGVAYVINCWRAHSMLRREINRIEQRGEPVWFADLAPPQDDLAVANGEAVVRLLSRFDRLTWDVLEDVANHALTDGREKQVEELIDLHRSDLRALLDLLRSGDCRFTYDFQTREPYRIPLRHVDELRHVDRLLVAQLHVALRKGNRQQAIQSLYDMLDLDRALRTDPFAVSQLVRKSIGDPALDGLQVAMAQEAIDEEDANLLGERLRESESRFRLADCIRAERALMLVAMENLGSPGMTDGLSDASAGISPTKAAILNYWWGSWPYRPRRIYEQTVMLRTMSEWAEIIDQPGPSATQRLAATFGEIRKEDFPIFHECSKHFANVRETGMRHRQRLLSAELALKVYRYRAAHGHLPESLGKLDDTTANECLGLLSGKPLVYEKTADGFAIYDDLPEHGRFEVKFARDPERR